MADSSALRQRILDGSTRALDRATEALLDQLQNDAPYRSGDTYRGITGSLGGDPIRPSATVTSATIQGEWANDGTRPHVIRPVVAKALRWTGPGGVVFAKQVNHPGTTGSHWFSNAVSFWPQRLQEALASAWDG